MDLYPAIDIRHGRVVRLSQGEATRQTVYASDPLEVAERFAAAGARWIHVVDLDRAFGDGDNAAVVAEIAARLGDRVRIQVGGGLRTLARVRDVLDRGAARIVIGTAAVTEPALVGSALEAAGPDRIAVGLDARDGAVALRGWQDVSALTVDEVASRVIAAGVRTIVYTDIGRDGMLVGPDVAGASRLQALGADVIASGGVAALHDLHAVRAAGLAGVIVGRAIYEGRFGIAEALAAAYGVETS